MAFHEELFRSRGGVGLLRESLARRGVSTVVQLHEFGPPDYEIGVSIFEPRCEGGNEQYSTSESLDWLVYASHESSITIAGGWLADLFRSRWLDWPEKTYRGPFSTPDLRGTWDHG